VHPTPVYETLAMGIAAAVLWRLRDRFAPGVLFGLYLMVAGFERFLVEFIRRNDEVVAGLTQPQLISLALMALGAAIVAVRGRVPRAATA
jgi:phosphatidylglycerol:prolipoprotein diacylglycerol transferase